jgi:putative transposase
MAIPQDANQRWSRDFVSDTLTDGCRFRILCVIDDFSRECLTIHVQRQIKSDDVLAVLAELFTRQVRRNIFVPTAAANLLQPPFANGLAASV